MKEFEIKGKLIVDDNVTHEELIRMLYIMLKEGKLFFARETKEVMRINNGH